MSRPSSLHDAIGAAVAPATGNAAKDAAGAKFAAEMDAAVADRDRNPEWFATLPNARQHQVNSWAERRAAQDAAGGTK